MQHLSDVQKEYLRRIRSILLPILLLSILAIGYLILKGFFHFRTACWSYTLFRVFCPGCGGTRMAFALLKGQFYQAFRYNPGLFLLIPVCGVVYIREAILYIRELYLDKWLPGFLYGVTAYIVLYAIVRNIPQFVFLAPTVVR